MLLMKPRPRGMPLHTWAYEGLRQAILERRLAAGERVPSTRALGLELGVARGTVVTVFEQLTAEGYLESRGGSGTYVARDLPDAWFEVKARRPAATAPRAPVLSRFGRSLTSPFPLAEARAPVPFAPYQAAVDRFPHEAWSRIVARHARRATVTSLRSGATAGLPALQRAIAAHVKATRGIACAPEQIVITSGAQQSLDLAARLLCDPGDRVWVEDPGYVGAHAILRAAGATLVPVPVDESGLRVDVGIARAPHAKLAYVTPAHQAPLGATMPADRRMALLDWAAQRPAWILEDDYDSEFRFESRPVPALSALDRAGVVVHLGTFNKTMFVGLRLAYVIAPPALVDRFVAAKSLFERFTPHLPQAALAEFIADGHYDRHLRRMRAVYGERRAALLGAIDEHLGGRLEVVGADAGIDLAALLPPGIDDVAVVTKLQAAGIDAVPLSAGALTPMPRGGLLLGFAAFTPAKLRAGVQALCKLL